MTTKTSSAIGIAAAALVALAGGAAQAEGNPYSLGAYQKGSYDSYMARYGGSGADWISTTGLRGGVDQTFGRQRLTATAAVNRNLYRRNSVLDNTDYSLDARLNWATVERISGLLAVQSSQSLFKNTLTTLTLGRNLLRTDAVALQAQIGVVTVWSFDAGVATNRQRSSNSSPTFAFLNQDQTTFSAGSTWAPTPDLSVRLGARRTDGKLPSFGDEFTRNDVELSGNVALSGASTVSARLSSTRVKHTIASFGQQKGWTGLASWNWQPTGKLKFSLSGSRDSSFGSVDQTGIILTTNSNNTRLTNLVALTTDWEATSKVLVNSRLSYQRRTFDSTTSSLLLGTTTPDNGKDSVTALSLGVRYLALRNLEFGCNAAVEDRKTSGTINSLPIQPYNARVYGCYGQAYLR